MGRTAPFWTSSSTPPLLLLPAVNAPFESLLGGVGWEGPGAYPLLDRPGRLEVHMQGVVRPH